VRASTSTVSRTTGWSRVVGLTCGRRPADVGGRAPRLQPGDAHTISTVVDARRAAGTGDEPDAPVSSAEPQEAEARRSRRGKVRVQLERIVHFARVVANADADEIEAAAQRLGESRRYLAPVAWAAGAIVLVIRGIKLLILNWRLTLIQVIPALWVWLVLWDLKAHTLRAVPFRQITVGGMIVLIVLAVALSIAAFWCNTVFGFAIDGEKPRIAPAARQANAHLGIVVVAGVAVGLLLAFAVIVVPRIGSTWLYASALGGVWSVMLISFVAIPARIIGAKRKKLPPRQAVGSWATGGALSAVAMTPGFLLDRLGLILLAQPGWDILGLVMLSAGTALYAAGMSSVRAVKLSMKLVTPG
jgi:hypothetical protein